MSIVEHELRRFDLWRDELQKKQQAHILYHPDSSENWNSILQFGSIQLLTRLIPDLFQKYIQTN